MGANPFDHSGAQIPFDPLQRRGRHDAQLRRLELEAMRPIGDPPAAAVNIFPRRDGGGSPDHRDQVPMAAHLHPEDAEARLLAVEGDAFHTACEVFQRRVPWR